LFAAPVWAQSQGTPTNPGATLSLKEAITLALAKHPVIAMATHALRAGEARVGQARAPYYPQIGASSIETFGSLRANAYLRPSGSLIQPNQSDFTAGLTASQLITDFGQTRYRLEAARLAAQALGEDVLVQKALVTLNVQKAYYEALRRQRLVDIAEKTVQERELIKQQVESLFRQQLKAKLDLDLVQVELSNAGVSLIQARNNLQASFAALHNAIGLTGPAAYTLQEPPSIGEERRSLDRLLEIGVENRPEMTAIRERISAAEQRVKAAYRQNFPTIQAVGSAGDTEQLAGRPKVREGGWWGAGVVVSVPLFTGFLIQHQVEEANAQLQEAQANARNLAQAVQLEITNAYLNVQTLVQQAKALEEVVNQTKEALQLAQERYRLGLSSVVEVTQGEVALTTAETNLAEAQYNYKAGEALLSYAVGEEAWRSF
jgi:outer membrane protein